MSLLVVKLVEERGDVAFACPGYKNARTDYAYGTTHVEPSDYILPPESASVNLELERWRDVESDTSKTLGVAPNDLQALFRRALARTELHKLNMARNDINSFFSHGGSPSEGHLLLDFIAYKESSIPSLPISDVADSARASDLRPNSKIVSAAFVVCESESVPGQRGAFASRDLKRGDLILSEKAVLSLDTQVPGHLDSEISNMSPHMLDRFLSLHNSHSACSCNSDSLFLGIFNTNSIPLAIKNTAGIFFDASMFNHACAPNAKHSFNAKTGELRIYALGAIRAGEEIFVSYICGRRLYGMPHQARQNELSARYHFTCACRVCALPRAELMQSDARRVGLNQLWDVLPRFPPKQATPHCKAIIDGLRTFSQEGLFGDTDYLLHDAANLCASHHDWVSAKYWAELAYRATVDELGEDNVIAEEARNMYEDPEALPKARLGAPKSLTNFRL